MFCTFIFAVLLQQQSFKLMVNYKPFAFHGHKDTEPEIFWSHDFDLYGSRDVIGHVTIGLGTCDFLLVVHWNHASILHPYGYIGLQR